MKTKSQPAQALPAELSLPLVAFDWADQKHDVRLLDPLTGQRHSQVLANKPEVLHVFFASLRERFAQRPVAVLLEAHRGALLHSLMGYEHLHLYPINPKQVARFREALHPSGAKDDPLDAEVILEFGRAHLPRLQVWQPDDVPTRKMRALSEARRRMVGERTKLTNRMAANLKGYFPQALELCGELSGPMAVAFLQKFKDLGELQRAKPQSVRRFYYAHHSRRADLIEQRLARIAAAVALTQDEAILLCGQLQTQCLLLQLRAVQQAIERYDKELEQLEQCQPPHPDYAIFASVPGVGRCLVPRLIAAFGTQRERWADAQQLATWCGVAPIIRGSGKSRQVRCRHACPRFVRQTFVELASSTSKYCDWAKAFYEEHQAREWSHNRILRALAFKWIRILWRLWRNHTPYDPKMLRTKYAKPTATQEAKKRSQNSI